MKIDNPSVIDKIVNGVKSVYSRMPKDLRDKLPRFTGVFLALVFMVIFASMGFSFSYSAE